ncbi:MAG: methyltransferase domain-containing protein [Fimbriimonadaceae bacterium]|nr:methyltransferase domain-containing protein [Fimbriimonadaceae bacterium]
MSSTPDRDYILGTHDEEIERLGLQHRVWRPYAWECWRTAGVTAGSRVVDLGAGPGYATVDLAEIVTPCGEVFAIERSAQFLAHAKNACAQRSLGQVQFQEADVMLDDLRPRDMDAVWCRWLASFVSDPALLVRKVAGMLRPGGRAMFHEYFDYAPWRAAPRRPALEEFTRMVMQSWRDAGGDPDVAVNFPPFLEAAGLKVIHKSPIVFAIGPDDYRWQWPKAFIKSGLDRLVSLGVADEGFAEEVRREFAEGEADPTAIMMTPIVLEIIAEKAGVH